MHMAVFSAGVSWCPSWSIDDVVAGGDTRPTVRITASCVLRRIAFDVVAILQRGRSAHIAAAYVTRCESRSPEARAPCAPVTLHALEQDQEDTYELRHNSMHSRIYFYHNTLSHGAEMGEDARTATQQ